MIMALMSAIKLLHSDILTCSHKWWCSPLHCHTTALRLQENQPEFKDYVSLHPLHKATPAHLLTPPDCYPVEAPLTLAPGPSFLSCASKLFSA